MDHSEPEVELVLGHDLSTLQQLEDTGRTFSDDGRVQPAEQIVAHHGATYIRERLWVNPPIPYNDLPHLLTMAKRIQAAGLKLLLDFHYSDFWADPSKQNTPQSWQGQALPALASTVYRYTRDVVEGLVRQGTPVSMVQTGNEVINGMLWPQGKIYVNGSQHWDQFITLLKAAIAGARDGSQHDMRIMVHIDQGGKNDRSRYFYDHLLKHGVDFDVIGLSYYPWWHGSLTDLQANLNDLALRYHKDIVIVETAYPWTLDNGDGTPNHVGPQTVLLPGYPPTPEGQFAYIRKILSLLNQVPNHRGRGIVYWESAWIPGVGWEPGAGNAWDNMTLFDRDGQVLPAIKCYEDASFAIGVNQSGEIYDLPMAKEATIVQYEEKSNWWQMGTTFQVFAYERSRGKNTDLWEQPFMFSHYGGQQGEELDWDFNNWLKAHRLFTHDEVLKGKWVKVSAHGINREVQLLPNGTLTECDLLPTWTKNSWPGTWELEHGVLVMRINGYDLYIYAASEGNIHSGVEIYRDRPNAYFKVIYIM